MAIFDETYRVVAVESQRLTIRPERRRQWLPKLLTSEDYPLGQLVALTDPASELPN
jgi:hypothetical protein